MADAGELSRFIDAQASIYETALAELEAGRKRSHWIWFVFPQIAGLGRSATARHYGIRSFAEARAYARHPLLRSRLLACTAAVCRHRHRTAFEIFGTPDDLKFRSSMTLFREAAEDPAPFQAALTLFYSGKADAETLVRLSGLEG